MTIRTTEPLTTAEMIALVAACRAVLAAMHGIKDLSVLKGALIKIESALPEGALEEGIQDMLEN